MGDELAQVLVDGSIEVRFEDQNRRKSGVPGSDNDSRHVQRRNLCESDVLIFLNLTADIAKQLVERIEIIPIDTSYDRDRVLGHEKVYAPSCARIDFARRRSAESVSGIEL